MKSSLVRAHKMMYKNQLFLSPKRLIYNKDNILSKDLYKPSDKE